MQKKLIMITNVLSAIVFNFKCRLLAAPLKSHEPKNEKTYSKRNKTFKPKDFFEKHDFNALQWFLPSFVMKKSLSKTYLNVLIQIESRWVSWANRQIEGFNKCVLLSSWQVPLGSRWVPWTNRWIEQFVSAYHSKASGCHSLAGEYHKQTDELNNQGVNQKITIGAVRRA